MKNVQFCPRSRKTKILTRGLKFESDAEIGQKGAFFKGLKKKVFSLDVMPVFRLSFITKGRGEVES
jgi:hypothetical protein